MKRLIVRIGLGIVMGGLLWGSLPANPAMADLVTFNFTGAVGEVSKALFPTLNAGQTLSGSFTFNDATSDSNGSSSIGRYNDTITALTVNVGPFAGTLGAESSSTGNNFIRIVNTPSLDTYDVRAPLAGSGVGNDPLFFRITLRDPSGSVFNSTGDSLPTTAPSLSSFASDRFRIIFENGDGIAKVRGNLTSLTAVPLPASVILFGAGLIALVGLGAGSWRQRKNSLA